MNIDPALDKVSIAWEDDVPGFKESHRTEISLATVKQLSTTGTPTSSSKPFPSQELWTTRPLDLPDYDYKAYMEDDSLLYDVVTQLRVQGLAFVNNIPGLESSLATIATRMGPIKDTFYGQTWDGESTVFRSSDLKSGK